MSEAEFDNGYWYATELKEFATTIGIPFANRLRKDQLERALKQFIRMGRMEASTPYRPESGVRDVDKGLRLDLPVVRYTSNWDTKAFLEREAAKLVPGFKRASGTRYLLNRWREEQLAAGRPITYRDLVEKAIDLNKTKRGPLRAPESFYPLSRVAARTVAPPQPHRRRSAEGAAAHRVSLGSATCSRREERRG